MNISCSANHQNSSFLVDTQADISIYRFSSISNDISIDKSNVVKIKGITNDSILSMGTACIKLYLGDDLINHEFHIVPDSFNIETDGIIGKDFLSTYHCKINYANMTFTINPEHNANVLKIQGGPDSKSIMVPPRSEVFRLFDVDTSEDCVVDNLEIIPGVFIAGTIISPRNAIVRVLNTTNSAQIIPKKLRNAEPLSNFNVYQPDQVSRNTNRFYELEKIMAKSIPSQFYYATTDLLSRYTDVFALPKDTMSVNNFYEQKLRIANDEPVYIKNYRTPHVQTTEINNQVNKLLANNLIEPSQANSNSPIILVPKKSQDKSKKWRMCIDYRAVNRKILGDKFPLPRIDDVLDSLGRAQFFSVIDLYNGFHQVPLEKESRDITSFSTSAGSFRWKVLPFGLNVSPNSFSRMMHLAFAGLQPDKLFIYMDDIIVTGKSEKDHLTNLEATFKACRDKNLKINPEKCNFFRSEVLFLGHVCSTNGVTPDPSKYDTIENYPIPHDGDAIRRFVAMANYYRKFIPQFALISAPLNRLTKKNAIFEWSPLCNDAFNKIKKCLTKPTTLAYPDYQQTFTVTVDASKHGCGAVLSQKEKPIAFASKSFSIADSKKATIEQELIAIHWAIKHFRHYLYGVHFIVKSDHKPLVYLFNLKDPSSKLTRLRLDLAEYDFVIEHIAGKDNVVADALSRIHISDIIKSQSAESIKVMTRSMTKNNSSLKNKETNEDNKVHENSTKFLGKKVPLIIIKIDSKEKSYKIMLRNKNKKIEFDGNMDANVKSFLREIFTELEIIASRNGICQIKLYNNSEIFTICTIKDFIKLGNKVLNKTMLAIVEPPQIITDPIRKQELIEFYHGNPIFGGHTGKNRLYAKLRQNFKWKNMTRDVANHVNKCILCQKNKVTRHTKMPRCITDTPGRAFEKISIDTVGPLPITKEGNRYLVTTNCNLSKFLIPISVPDKSARTVAKALVENIFLIFGFCREILTDLGTEYINSIIDEILKILQIKHTTSTPYRPQTMGGIERSHRTLNEYLRTYLIDNTNEWDTYSKYFAYCYNVTPNTSFDCNYTPFELVFGHAPKLIDALNGSIEPVYNLDSYSKEMKFKMQTSNKIAQQLLAKRKQESKIAADAHIRELNIKINDKVLVLGNNHKLESVYDGPFTVTAISEYNVTVRNDSNKKQKTIHKNRIIKFKE